MAKLKMICSRCNKRFNESEDVLLSHFDWEPICKLCQSLEKDHMFHEEATKTSLSAISKADLFGLPSDWDEHYNKRTKGQEITSGVTVKKLRNGLTEEHPFYELYEEDIGE